MTNEDEEFRKKILSIIPDPTSIECKELMNKERNNVGTDSFAAGWYAALSYLQHQFSIKSNKESFAEVGFESWETIK